jgi:AraC-like DNA-binding protein
MTIEEISSNSYSLFLIILTLLIVKNFEQRNNVFKIEFVKQKTKWLKQILIIGLSACIIWIAEIYLMQDITIDGKNTDVSLSIYYPIWIIISIIIYWLSYVGLFQSNLHVERIEIRNKIISEKNDIMYYVDETKKKSKGLKQEKKFTEFQDIISKNYMNPNLNLNEVSLMLNISSNYLSQIISNNNISFNDYVNSVRVENVKLKLNDENYSNYTITSIGLESGFNSNASFYRAFRKHTGISPTTFKKNTH